MEEPFNGKSSCISRYNERGQSLGNKEEDNKNRLTRKKDGWFTINELEVWAIKITKEVTVKASRTT
jgi:hypothetical protein